MKKRRFRPAKVYNYASAAKREVCGTVISKFMTSQLIVGKEVRRLGRSVAAYMRARNAKRHGGRMRRSYMTALALLCAAPLAATAALYLSIPEETLSAAPNRVLAVEPVRLPDLRGQMAAIEAVKDPISHEIVVGSAETLTSLLARMQVRDPQAAKFIRSAPEASALLYPKAGQFVTAVTGEDGKLEELCLYMDSDTTGRGEVVAISRTEKGFTAQRRDYEYDTELTMMTGVIEGSADTSLQKAGVPARIVDQMHGAFDYDRDIVKTLKTGDAFRIIYETKYAQGSFVRYGRLLALQLDHGEKTTELFWFGNDGTGGNFYDAAGNISRRTFMRVPLDVVSVTSEFSPMRRHPITGVLRPHLGTDFRAPWGAVVRAAADGKITFAGTGTGYGKYIRIAHGPDLQTVYAHLSSISPHIKPGTEVKYGEEIGRVGQTGLATGPHLHYELKLDGVQINPMKARLPDRQALTPYQLAQMEVLIAPLRAKLAILQKVQVSETLHDRETKQTQKN